MSQSTQPREAVHRSLRSQPIQRKQHSDRQSVGERLPRGRYPEEGFLKIESVMQVGASIPAVSAETSLSDALLEISQKGLGMTTVATPDNKLAGIFTDGDLRRALDARVDLNETPISQLMSTGAKTVTPGMLAAEATFKALSEESTASSTQEVSYEDAFKASWMHEELHKVRNIRPG